MSGLNSVETHQNDPFICATSEEMGGFLCGVFKFSSVTVLLMGILFSFHINIRLVYIICHTFKDDHKLGYYPVLLLMSMLAWPSAVFLFVNIFVMVGANMMGSEHIFLDDGKNGFSLKMIPIALTMVSFFTYPLTLAFLDFLLCSHRLFSIFEINFKLMTVEFRWFGPLVFIVLFPVILMDVFWSSGHKIGKQLMMNLTFFGINFDLNFIMFFIDNILKIFFTFFSVGGYLLILLKVMKVRKRINSENPKDDIYIIKQALPIAICQMIFVILNLSCDIVCTEFSKLLLDLFSFLASTIVVPVSIISGNPQKRKIYWNSRCCCQKMEKDGSVSSSEQLETRLQTSAGLS